MVYITVEAGDVFTVSSHWREGKQGKQKEGKYLLSYSWYAHIAISPKLKEEKIQLLVFYRNTGLLSQTE